MAENFILERWLPVVAQIPRLLLQLWACLEEVEVVENKFVRVIYVQDEAKLPQKVPFDIYQLSFEFGILLQAYAQSDSKTSHGRVSSFAPQ